MRYLLFILFLIPTVFFTIWYQNRIPVESVLAHVNGSFVVVDDVEAVRRSGEPLGVALDRAIDRRLVELEAARAGVAFEVVDGFFNVFQQWNPTPEQERRVREAEAQRSLGGNAIRRDDLANRMKDRAKAQYVNELRSKAIIEKYIP